MNTETIGNYPLSTAAAPLPETSQSMLLKLFVAFALAWVLVGCKIVIVVPDGGRVESLNGEICLAGETCILDVSDTNFSDTFEAIPATGYEFDQWENSNGYFCGGSALTCALSTTGFAGVAALEAVLATDTEFFLAPIFTETNPRYDVAEWSQLIDGLNSSTHTSNAFLYSIVPNPGSCDPGVLTAAAETRFTDTVNLIRKLHYLPEVEYDSFYSTQMQEAALVQLANNYLSHFPSPGDNCYTSGAAAGAGSANLAASSIQRDPAHYALGWTNDNNNIAALMEAGHRRWMLLPNLGFTSYGQAAGFSGQKVFGFGQTTSNPVSPDVEYVAFPFMEYPYVMVSQGSSPTPWSISMIPPAGVSSNFNHFENATVTVTETSSGSPLVVNNEHHDNIGFGLANFFSWMVVGWAYDTQYTVTISNILMQDSSVQQISYPVSIEFSDLQPGP